MNQFESSNTGLRRLLPMLMLSVTLGTTDRAEAAQQNDLTSLSIEDLMDMEITSVSRKREPLSNAASAIYVITQEDIRRSGVTSIPEALRMVPGLQVAATDANKWAISSRGLNLRFARYLLVLIDGRSVYNPLFSGVYWDVQDTDLDSIERIEVIRGPGGTMWGSNAVNGVINIITKKATATEGAYLSTGWGSHEKGFGTARWGGKLGQNASYRAFGKYFRRGAFKDSESDNARDSWKVGRGGARVDWTPNEADTLTLEGEWYNGDAKQRITLPNYPPTPPSSTFSDTTDITGSHVLGRWTRRFSDTSDLALQYFYDRTERSETFLDAKFEIFDVDFQHRFAPGRDHDVVWGGGYRLILDRVRGTFVASLDPMKKRTDQISAFLQDEITLIPDELRLTLGMKVEQNHYTGWEYQPNARLLWTPTEHQTLWAAVSRAVQTPSRTDDSLRFITGVIPGAPNILTGFIGNKHMESTDLLSYELGYRVQPQESVSLDLAAFLNIYDKLITALILPPTLDTSVTPAALAIFGRLLRNVDARAFGFEAAANWNATSRWRLRSAYTFTKLNINPKQSTPSATAETAERQTPTHQFNIRSFYDLTDTVELDAMLYVVGNLSGSDTHSYTRLDVRLGWMARPNLELSIAGQNLLEHRHKEFGPGDDGVLASEVPRSFYGRVTWRY